MANLVLINDNELRRRLRGHRFKPDGPITNTTREVYFRKLQRLDNARTPPTSAAAEALALNSPSQGISPFGRLAQHATTVSPTPHRFRHGEHIAITSRGARLPALSHSQSDVSTSLREDAPRIAPIIHGIGILKCANTHIVVYR